MALTESDIKLELQDKYNPELTYKLIRGRNLTSPKNVDWDWVGTIKDEDGVFYILAKEAEKSEEAADA